MGSLPSGNLPSKLARGSPSRRSRIGIKPPTTPPALVGSHAASSIYVAMSSSASDRSLFRSYGGSERKRSPRTPLSLDQCGSIDRQRATQRRKPPTQCSGDRRLSGDGHWIDARKSRSGGFRLGVHSGLLRVELELRVEWLVRGSVRSCGPWLCGSIGPWLLSRGISSVALWLDLFFERASGPGLCGSVAIWA